MQSIIIGSAVLFLITIQGGSAIKCYECNSHKEADCALDIPPDEFLKDCATEYSTRVNGPSTYCRKIKQNIDIPVNNLPPDSRIIRKCGFENETKTDYCYTRSGDGGRQVVCTCDKDKCNGAGALESSIFAILATMTCVAVLFLKRN